MKEISAFFTCGIGDFLAILSWLSIEERDSITKIYWGTRQRKNLEPLAALAFPNLKEQISMYDKFTGPENVNMFYFASLSDMFKKIGVKINDDNLIDFSVGLVFIELDKGRRKYHKSLLEKNILCDISRFKLPDKYLLIHPCSDNAPTDARDLTKKEWEIIIDIIELIDIEIIVINKGVRQVPMHIKIRNLTNQTTIIESLEIIKRADSFLGATSYPSVFASKFLNINKILVKGYEALKERFWLHYYYPLPDNFFIEQSLTEDRLNKFFKGLL